MDASRVLLERILMALAAGLGPLDRVLAHTLDVARRPGMVLEVDIAVAAGTSDRLVYRSREGFTLHVQGERFPIRQILLETLLGVALETRLVGI
jgi:hypothetical protein